MGGPCRLALLCWQCNYRYFEVQYSYSGTLQRRVRSFPGRVLSNPPISNCINHARTAARLHLRLLMKQLLDTTLDSYVIFALNDRVFVGRCCSGGQNVGNRDESAVVEQSASSDERLPTAGTSFLYELDLCKEGIGLASTQLPETASTDNGDGPSGYSGSQGERHPYQVQAVTIAKVRNTLVCGVACYNKSLLLYEIDLRLAIGVSKPGGDGGGSSEGSGLETVFPKTSHKTFKRCCCMCFATVRTGRRAAGTDCGKGDEACAGLLTLIAGDLTGDAVAFPFHAMETGGDSARSDTKPSATSEVSGPADSAQDVPKNCRLLLGHTASMLTGVRVVSTNDNSGRVKCRILTSDRDEKVRVSSFPDAFRIEGYLLGHEAFISALDVASAGHVTRCATCSGDGTVRLWDYVQFQQVASYSSPEDGLVPSRVAIASTGNRIAVIYDESPRLDILQVTAGPDAELRLACTFDLASSALSLSWLDDDTDGSAGNSGATLIVLITGPPFVQIFHLDVASGRPVPMLTLPMVSVLSKVLTGETVLMPSSVLEKDQSGKLTMTKNREKRGPRALQMPWNNPERKHIAKEREKRHKNSRHLVKESDGGTHSPP